MKQFVYDIQATYETGPKDNTETASVFYHKTMPFNEQNRTMIEEFVKEEAYNGEYTVEDIPDPPHTPTLEERNRADIDYLAMETGVILE